MLFFFSPFSFNKKNVDDALFLLSVSSSHPPPFSFMCLFSVQRGTHTLRKVQLRTCHHRSGCSARSVLIKSWLEEELTFFCVLSSRRWNKRKKAADERKTFFQTRVLCIVSVFFARYVRLVAVEPKDGSAVSAVGVCCVENPPQASCVGLKVSKGKFSLPKVCNIRRK